MLFVFFNDTATTEIYTLSLYDALPISPLAADRGARGGGALQEGAEGVVGDAAQAQPHPVGAAVRDGAAAARLRGRDRKSTSLTSSHANISYAVFFLNNKHANVDDRALV